MAVHRHRPLGVGAGVADQVGSLAAGGVLGQPADQLGLLAAHDVGAVEAVAAQAGHDGHPGVFARDIAEPGGQGLGVGGAVDVGGFLPADVGAGHAGDQGRQVRCAQGQAHHVAEHDRRLAGLQLADAHREFLVRQRHAVGVHGPDPQIGGAPVDGEIGGFGHGVPDVRRQRCAAGMLRCAQAVDVLGQRIRGPGQRIKSADRGVGEA